MADLRRSSPPTWALGLLAVGADVAWRALLLAPWAFMLLTGALWWRQAWAIWLALGALVLIGWALSSTEEVEGHPVTRADAPALFDNLDRVQRELDCVPVARVLLDPSFNAGVVDGGTNRWTGRSRHVLVIGWPLLAVLNEAQARAVLAHELGHLSRRHGRLGHWIYRARQGWLQLSASDDDDSSPFDRAVTWFASRFGPWFAQQSFAYSRQCEFEADADAARMAQPADLVAALTAMRVGQARMNAWWRQDYGSLLATREDALLVGWRDHLPALMGEPPRPDEIASAWDQQPGPTDTHPTLPQRAAALGVPGAGAVALEGLPAQDCAGAAWFVDWPGQRQAAAQRVAAAQRWESLALHLWLAELKRWLDNESATNGAPGSLAKAEALRQLHRDAQSVDMLERLAAGGSPDPQRDFALALGWLNSQDDPSGRHDAALQLLEGAVQADPALAYRARSLALGTARSRRDAVAIARLETLLQRAGARRQQATEAAHASIESGAVQGPQLPPHALTAIDALCMRLPGFRQSWIGHVEVNNRDGRRFNAQCVVVQVDPVELGSAGVLEHELVRALEALVDAASPHPGDVSVVRMTFSTETALPQILARTAARHWQSATPGLPLA